jgi:hypothetical protein
VVKKAFTAAFQQQHRTSRAVLEGAFRGFDEVSESPEHLQGNLLQLSCFCNNKDWLLHLACNSTSQSAAVPAAIANEAAKAAEAATAAAACSTAVGHSLLASCIKLFQAAQAVHKPFAWQAVELAVQVATISCAAAAEAAQQDEEGKNAGDARSGASGSKSAAAAAAAASWYWLCGRCLVLAGMMLQQCDTALQDSEATVLQARVQQTPKQVFGGIAAAVTNLQSALGGQLDAAATAIPAGAAAARERLVLALGAATAECSEKLEQLLLAARAAAESVNDDETDSSSSSSGGVGSASGRGRSEYLAVQCLQEVDTAAAAAVPDGQQGLGQQLVAFGRAVCGVSASSVCCNNPSCSSRAQSSEGALVGGKSSRCSACKMARYCSRDCQVR